MDLELEGRVVVITGGAKGIGAAAVRAFVREGAHAVIVDRDAVTGSALADALKANGGQVDCVEADLARETDCRRAVERILVAHGAVDVLVNNAGFNDAVGLDRPPEDFRRSLQRNLEHVYTLTHLLRAKLVERRGAVINLGSKVACTGQGGTSGYAAAKGAIHALTREWAAALAPAGVRVNAVLPAECQSDQYERFFQSQPDPVASRAAVEALVPLGHRLTRPEEIADMIVFLASPRAGHVTGQLIFVDGGYTHLDRALSQADHRWG